MKKAIYFVKTKDGKIRYKTDTFWSTSENVEYAKIHTNSKYDQDRFLGSFIGGFKYYLGGTENEVDDLKKLNKDYKGSIYGYRIIEDENFTGYRLGDKKLSDPIYLTVIDEISKSGTKTTDYKVINRDIKIEKILKN